MFSAPKTYTVGKLNKYVKQNKQCVSTNLFLYKSIINKSKHICHNRCPYACMLIKPAFLASFFSHFASPVPSPGQSLLLTALGLMKYKGKRLWKYLNINNCFEKQNRNLLWGLYMSKAPNLVFLELNTDRENINIPIFKDTNIKIFTVMFLLFHFLLIFAIISQVAFIHISKGYPR